MVPFYKTRLAPTPSGFLHAGNALNFWLTATLARRCGAGLLLRIDDLDQPRCRDVYLADIFETLRFLQLSWNEGPQNETDVKENWSQQRRLPLYQETLEKLKAQKKLFACGCSRAVQDPCNCQQRKLPFDQPGVSWRLLTGEEPLTVNNADGSKTTARLPDELKNFVVRRKDGLPAYQLASVVDDLNFGIDFIVRGEDLWPSTLAQLYLAAVLEAPAFTAIRFFHHPLLVDASGEKLSKSAGSFSVKHWREKGKSRADLLAYLGEQLCVPKPVNKEDELTAALGL